VHTHGESSHGSFDEYSTSTSSLPTFALVEQGLTSHSTQLRSFRRRCFYRSDDLTNSVKALKDSG